MDPTPLRFDAFAPQTRAEWEALVARALRGKDRDRALLHTIEPGYDVEPYWLPDEGRAAAEAHASSCARRTRPGWIIREDVQAIDGAEIAAAVDAAVVGGATGIGLPADADADAVRALIAERPDVRAWHLGSPDAAVRRAALDARGGADVLVTVDAAPAGEPAADAPTGVRDLPIDTRRYHRAGAAPSLQIGLALAEAAEHLDRGGDSAALRMHVLTSLDTDFFPALARLRALRLGYGRLLDAFELDPARLPLFVQAETTWWGLTRRDPYSNVIRATVGAVAAAAGGADVIRVLPYDAVASRPEPDALRLARNTQHVLRDEAFLDRVADPGAGSYYVEALTDGLARRSWDVLQEVERQGGFDAARASGWIEEQLEQSARRAADDVQSGRSVLVGATAYAAPESATVLAREAESDSMERGAAAFEALRDQVEAAARSADAVAVRLVPVGSRAMAAARASWVADLLRAGGLRVELAPHAPDAGALRERLAAAPRCIVLCGDDDAYPDVVPAARAALGARTCLYVAGDPAADLDVYGRLHRGMPRLESVRGVARAAGLLS